jgi:hypothetical protein
VTLTLAPIHRAVFYLVLQIGFRCIPLQIYEPVVPLFPVEMSSPISGRTRAAKCLKHQTMNLAVHSLLSVNGDADVEIPVFI